MARSRRKRPDPESIRQAKLYGLRCRLCDLTEHRIDLDDDERARRIVETEAEIAALDH